MVDINLTQARDELAARGFDYLSASRLTLMLNNAKNELEDEWRWPWLETTTTGTAPLAIADLKQVLSVVDTTNLRKLTGIDARDVTDRDPITTTAGTADSFWLDGTGTLQTYPANTTASLSVRYVKYSPELSADTDTPLIPVRYHYLWISYAVVDAYIDSDNYSTANALLSHLREYRLPQMIETFALRNRANPDFAVTTWAFDN